MAPLGTFVKPHATNGVPVLSEYTFALCSTGAWPFPSTMDINILSEACLAYDTPANSENVPDDPIITGSDTNAEPGKMQCRHKAKSKSWSKSAGANSSASEVSPGHKKRNPRINKALPRRYSKTCTCHLMDRTLRFQKTLKTLNPMEIFNFWAGWPR